MTRQLAHFPVKASRYDMSDLDVASLPLEAVAYPLSVWASGYAEGEDRGLYINVRLPGGNKAIEIILTVEQLAEAMLGCVRAHNRMDTVDDGVKVADECR